MSNAQANWQIGLLAIHRQHHARHSVTAKVGGKYPENKRGQQRAHARREQ